MINSCLLVALANHFVLPWQCLNFFPLPQGHGVFLPTFPNVLGSNLFNSLGILGAASIASYPGLLKTPQSFISYDLPVMLFLTIILGGYLFYFKKIDRIFGPVLLIFYGIYIFMNFS